MANNIQVTQGSGTEFKTTETAGVHTGHVNVDNTVAVSGTVTANLSATDNAVLDAIEADTTTLAGAVSGTEMQVDIVSSALPSGAATETTLNAVLTAVGDVETAITANQFEAVAHDAADAGDSLKFGFKAVAALSGVTLVAAADRTDSYADLDGALLVRPHAALGDGVDGNASNTDGTSTSVIAAQGAGIKTYITDIEITNTSASNIYVELKDGATTRKTFPVPANAGVVKTFATPLGGTANTAWNFHPSAATTTVYCSASGFKSKI